jgi:anthranilate/para-aminobenzoate synthase component II
MGVFAGIDPTFDATRYHSLVVDPDTFPHDALEVTAEAENGTIMGLQHREHPLHGIQFHPESVMTKAGPKIIENWLSLVWNDERLSPTA